MGSAPRTSEAPVGHDHATSAPSLGRDIADRHHPQLRLGRRSTRHARPGQLMRATQTFGLRLGLSQQNRRQYEMNTGAFAGLTGTVVRPPIDYWPWPDAAEAEANEQGRPGAAARAAVVSRAVAPEPPKSKADQKLDALKRMLLGPRPAAGSAQPSTGSTGSTSTSSTGSTPAGAASSAAAAPVRRSVHRGLPLTPRRKGRTWAGPRTSPGGMAEGAAPQNTNSVSPSRFGSGAPEPLPSVAASGISDSDRSGGAATTNEPPASREEQLRRMLAGNGTIRTAPGTAGMTADRAAELVEQRRAVAERRPAERAAAAAAPADTRPTSVLGRSIANTPGRQAPSTPERRVPEVPPPAVAATATSPRPVSAEMLRSIARRSANPVAASPSNTGPAPIGTTNAAPSAPDRSITDRSGANRPETTQASAAPDPARATSADAVRSVDGEPPTSSIDPVPTAEARSAGTPAGALVTAMPLSRAAEPLSTAQRSLSGDADTPGSGRLFGGDRLVNAGLRDPQDAPDSLVATAAVHPPYRFEMVDTQDAPNVLAPLPLATSQRTTTQTASGIATLPRPARRGVETLRRSVVAAERTSAAWGPRHRHGLDRSPDGRRIQWDASVDAADSTVVAGVSFSTADLARATPDADGSASPHHTGERRDVPAIQPVSRESLATVAPPIHRVMAEAPADPASSPRSERIVAPTSTSTTTAPIVARSGTTQQVVDRPHARVATDSPQPGDRSSVAAPTPGRAGGDWVSTERVMEAERLLAPARTAPPRALEGALQRALVESSELTATLDDLVVSSPRALVSLHEIPAVEREMLTGPVPVTAAAIAQAMTTVARATPAPAKPGQATSAPATSARATVARTTPAQTTPDASPTASAATTPSMASPLMRSASAPDVRRAAEVARRGESATSSASGATSGVTTGSPGQHWVPARPGTLFSRVAGVSLLQRTASFDPSARVPLSRGGDDLSSAPAVIARSVPSAPSPTAAAQPASVRPAMVQPVRPENLDGAVPQTPPPTPGKRRRKGTQAPVADVLRTAADDAGTSPVADDAVARRPVAPVPAAELADRFLTELTRHRQERPKPLPTQFASIAEMIVGNRRAHVSTGEASQRALASVNKVAATTGNVIHLARPVPGSNPSAELTGIIAHELTHVAAPSPAPRFFDDDRHTAEERRASEIGEIMRRSPAPPPSGSIATRGGSPPMSMLDERGARTHTPTARAAAADTIRRSLASSVTPTSSQNIQRVGVVMQPPTDEERVLNTVRDEQAARSANTKSFEQELRDHFDVLVELLEDRIISDIERRGGRYRGDF